MSPTPTIPNLPTVRTVGETFPCGAILELLDDCQLLLHHDGRETVGTTIEYGGTLYEPESLDPALARALHLPVGTTDYPSLDSLAAELSNVFAESAALEESCARWCARFVLQTWIRDALSSSPVLNLWGAEGTQEPVLRLLELLCRHPLRLFEPSLGDLGRLPQGLAGTLLLDRPSLAALRPLLSTNRGAHLLRGGRLIRPEFSVLVTSDAPLPGTLSRPMLSAVSPAQRVLATASILHSRCDQLRAKLLRFRLQQHGRAKDSVFDLPGLSPALRLAAHSYGATVAGSEILRAQLTADLVAADEEAKAESSKSLPALVVEVLLACTHDDCSAMSVSDLAEAVNALLRSRGEASLLTPKALGVILRRQLGLAARRKEHGYELSLDGATRRRIHALAQVHAPLSSLHRFPNCVDCARYLAGAPSPEVPDVDNVHDPEPVQNVPPAGRDIQNVQDVQKLESDSPDCDEPAVATRNGIQDIELEHARDVQQVQPQSEISHAHQ